MIQVVTIKDFRKSFEKYADDVANYNETIIVARPEQKNVVVISEKEYNSWQETNYLLQSKANNNTLAHSTNQLSVNTDLKLSEITGLKMYFFTGLNAVLYVVPCNLSCDMIYQKF